MNQLMGTGGRELAVRLMVPGQRWGWECVPPEPARPSPLRGCEPLWTSPVEPEGLVRLRARARWIPVVGGAAVAMAGYVSLVAAAWGLLWPAAGGAVLAPVVLWCGMAGSRYRAALRAYQRWATSESERFTAEWYRWRAQLDAEEQQERCRVASARVFFPVSVGRWSWVNVFGGTVIGWSNLLATVGLSALSSGARLLVLDFGERAVGARLAELAASVGYPVALDRVPEAAVAGVEGLTADQAGELAAEALTAAVAAAGPETGGHAHAVVAELVSAVCGCLSGEWTVQRLAAGLTVLQRGGGDWVSSCLSAPELRALTAAAAEVVGSSAAVAEQLRFAAATMRLLASAPGAAVPVGRLWPEKGLRLLVSADAHARRKDVVDRWLLARLVHDLRSGGCSAPATVVVAGADRINSGQWEALTRHAGRVGVRVIVLSERLRGDSAQRLGSPGSATVLMRLENAEEAAAAADFIGRGHRFVLSQTTEQVGHSVTDGVSDTDGDSLTSTTTDNYGPSAGSSESRSRASSWSHTTNWSVGENSSTAQTWVRAYEYTVEPTVLQGLPDSAFVWVKAGPSGRRVVAADCDPAIALRDRVAAEPREDTGVVSW